MATTKNDDDLIIIEEDNNINIDNDINLVDLDTTETNELISFDDEIKTDEVSSDLKLDNSLSNNNEELNLDLSDDEIKIDNSNNFTKDEKINLKSGSLETEESDKKTDTLEDLSLETEESDNFDFGGLEEEKVEDNESLEDNSSILSSDTNKDETMVSILDGTITKLQLRKNKSAKQIENKIANVNDIETEIAKLQDEKKEIQLDIKILESENKKIDSNVSSLEKMKDEDDAVKNHNSKRKTSTKSINLEEEIAA